MKFLKSHILLLILGMLALTSCEDYFGDINEDPDNPLEVTPAALLPQVQVRLAYVLGGDASRYTGIYTQHIDGVSRQFVAYQNYNLIPADFDNMWANLYSGVMADNRQLQRVATEEGYIHYLGVSKAIEAYTLLLITDLWGDVPYSEAFQGRDNLQPAFDSQEDVYTSVFNLIEEARRDITAEDGGILVPGADDLFYGGTLAKWEKFLSMLEARARIHLGLVDDANYTAALDAISKAALIGPSDDARLKFGTSSTENAPWFQYIQQRDDIEIGDSYVDTLTGLGDPRLSVYGALLDVNGPADPPAHPVFLSDRSFPVLTYVEMKFIEAEAAFQTGNTSLAHQSYLDAVNASLNEALEGYDFLDSVLINVADSVVSVAVDDLDLDVVKADYIATIDPGEDNLTLENIMFQKYLAMLADQEVYTDWRRTGIPELPPNTGTQIPVRFPYAQTEIFSNENTPSTSSVNQFTPVWWDR